jgi:hypothetical protein
VQRGEPFTHPERWEDLGEADATGDEATADAVDQLSEDTGWYRAKIKDEPNFGWNYCHVSLHRDTGEKLIRQDTPPL